MFLRFFKLIYWDNKDSIGRFNYLSAIWRNAPVWPTSFDIS